MTSDKRSSLFSYFLKHPVLLLLLLSPGIPEYLSSSSPLSALFLNPSMFLFQIIANLGLYGPGVLLVREALIQWKKSWGSSLVLGAAYGIVEEGVALSTMFNPNSSSSSLHGYGWWLGVNWIWSPTISLFHAVFSITLPILLFQIALPEKRNEMLLTGRKINAVFAIFLADIVTLMGVVYYGEHFFIGFPRLIGSIACIIFLVFIGAKMPSTILLPISEIPKRRPIVFAMLGLAFFPIIIFGESIGRVLNVPVGLLAVIVLGLEGTVLLEILRLIGRSHNSNQLVALAAGLLTPVAIFGFVAQIKFPLVIIADLLLVFFLNELWKMNSHEMQDWSLNKASQI